MLYCISSLWRQLLCITEGKKHSEKCEDVFTYHILVDIIHGGHYSLYFTLPAAATAASTTKTTATITVVTLVVLEHEAEEERARMFTNYINSTTHNTTTARFLIRSFPVRKLSVQNKC